MLNIKRGTKGRKLLTKEKRHKRKERELITENYGVRKRERQRKRLYKGNCGSHIQAEITNSVA
jgi:hypothetical protein